MIPGYFTKFREVPGITRPYYNQIGISAFKPMGILGKVSDLLTAEDSAEMSYKYKNGRSFTPKGG